MTDREELRALLAKATPQPWSLCQHLKSVEDDAACRCGYRGVVWGPEHEVAMAVFQPGHEPAPEGQEGSEPGRYDRPTEIANSQLIVAAVNILPLHLERIAALEAALAPFAAYAAHFDRGGVAQKPPRAGDYRRARAQLEAASLTSPDTQGDQHD